MSRPINPLSQVSTRLSTRVSIRVWRSVVAIGLGASVMFGSASTLRAQAPAETPRNPYTPEPRIIQEGQAAFRANCAYCHGMDARGMRAPDLTGVYSRGATEEGLYRLVRRGIPGTEMPPASVFLQEPDTWKVLMYLRTLAVDTRTEPEKGNAENGERLFRARCASCHRVNGRGGVLGPDLSRIGVSRTRAALARQIRGGNETIKPGNQSGVCHSALAISGAQNGFENLLLQRLRQLRIVRSARPRLQSRA